MIHLVKQLFKYLQCHPVLIYEARMPLVLGKSISYSIYNVHMLELHIPNKSSISTHRHSNITYLPSTVDKHLRPL